MKFKDMKKPSFSYKSKIFRVGQIVRCINNDPNFGGIGIVPFLEAKDLVIDKKYEILEVHRPVNKNNTCVYSITIQNDKNHKISPLASRFEACDSSNEEIQ